MSETFGRVSSSKETVSNTCELSQITKVKMVQFVSALVTFMSSEVSEPVYSVSFNSLYYAVVIQLTLFALFIQFLPVWRISLIHCQHGLVAHYAVLHSVPNQHHVFVRFPV